MKKLLYATLWMVLCVPSYDLLLAQEAVVIIGEEDFTSSSDGYCWVRPRGNIIVTWNQRTCTGLEFDLTNFYYEPIEPNGEVDWNSLELLSWHGLSPSPEAPILYPIWELVPIEAPSNQPGELNVSIAFLITGTTGEGIPMGCLDTLILPPFQYECQCIDSEEELYADYEIEN